MPVYSHGSTRSGRTATRRIERAAATRDCSRRRWRSTTRPESPASVGLRRLLEQIAPPSFPALVLAVASASMPASAATAQIPLAPPAKSGEAVTPVFEGWYRNPDGTFSLSFGYFNRNFEETLEVPVGEHNFVSPGPADRNQPTVFEPRRHWGVFTVKVPSGFGDGEIVWTMDVRGERWAIPGSLNPLWEIDALEGEAGSGNTPPVLRFSADGPAGAGPGGIEGPSRKAEVGQPLVLEVWATDDGRASTSVASSGRSNVPVRLTWLKHRGPGEVTFEDDTPPVGSDHRALTRAVFSEPGEYILRVRANDASGVDGAGHAQCCWTNGYLKVSVSGRAGGTT